MVKLAQFHTDKAPPSGDNDKFSTVARSSSTLAEIGADPLFNGLISTCILRPLSSLSESLSESDSAEIRKIVYFIKCIFYERSLYLVRQLLSNSYPFSATVCSKVDLLAECNSHLHQHLAVVRCLVSAMEHSYSLRSVSPEVLIPHFDSYHLFPL